VGRDALIVQFVKGATASANWTAADAHSGLATPASGGVPLDTSSVGQKTAMLVAGAARDNVGLQSAVATCGYTVVYQFAGFFQPVDNPPTMNQGNAGRAVPVKFSLGGNQGLGIFAAGSPISQQVSCSTSAPISDLEETGTAGSSELTYDVSTDRYTYVWKTETSWAGTCRQLMVKLNDGAEHPALFRFR
jgi:hypothetical protein